MNGHRDIEAFLLDFAEALHSVAVPVPDGSPLLAALILGLAALLQGRRPNHAYGTMIIPGLLQLAPGFVGTEAVLALLRGHEGTGAESATFFKVGLVTVQLVIGLMLAPLLLRRRQRAPGPL